MYCKQCNILRSTLDRQNIRELAMEKLGGARCINCGCTEKSILEINHISGGGRIDFKKKSPNKHYRDIARGVADLKEYNVLCKICNIHHYVETILGIKGFTVIYT